MFEVRIVEILVRVSRHGPEPGGWSVLLCDGGVVLRDYPCHDHSHTETVSVQKCDTLMDSISPD